MNTLNVLDFGAKGDGTTDCRPAFQKVITAANYCDTVIIPDGNFFLKDNIKTENTGLE